jgi:hypothetical protein
LSRHLYEGSSRLTVVLPDSAPHTAPQRWMNVRASTDTNDNAAFPADGIAVTRDWVGFHCGAVPMVMADAARLVIATGLPDHAAPDAGCDKSQDTSATVIPQVCHPQAGRAAIAGVVNDPVVRDAVADRMYQVTPLQDVP